MSLLKQLLISVSVAILVILVGTLAFSIGAAKQYLDGQLQAQSENAVSALALSLSQPANQDEVTRELLMMALFDSGQFRVVRLVGTDGQPLFERLHPDIQGMSGAAPRWFSEMLPLAEPIGVRVVSDGWRQVGKLEVAVDSAYARDALWQSSVRMLLMVVGAGLVWALFVSSLLRWFRKVLHEEIVAQVQAIGSQQSGGPVARPRVAELAEVVLAISDTRERVRTTAQEQTQRIESLELELNRDPVTRLPNRRYFMNELRRVLQQQGGGHVMLFRQRDLQALNVQMGRRAADAWLAEVTERVQEALAQHDLPAALPARLNGSDFVILLPNLAGMQSMHIVQQLRQVLQAKRVPLQGGQWCRWAYSLTDYATDESVSEVMSRLDHALMKAESGGHHEVEYEAYGTVATPRGSKGDVGWQDVLQNALSMPGQLFLAVQPVHSEGAQCADVRYEAGLQLQGPGSQPLAGALFLPVAVRLGLSADFDVRAVQMGLQWLGQHPDDQLIVRLSLPSLTHPQFLSRLRDTLFKGDDALALRQRLVLELDAHGLIAYPEEVQAFSKLAEEAQTTMGLRRLDQQPMALVRLHTMPLRYVKLGGEFADKAESSPGSRHLLEAMTDTARTLGLRVYVTDTLNADTARLLRAKGACIPVASQQPPLGAA